MDASDQAAYGYEQHLATSTTGPVSSHELRALALALALERATIAEDNLIDLAALYLAPDDDERRQVMRSILIGMQVQGLKTAERFVRAALTARGVDGMATAAWKRYARLVVRPRPPPRRVEPPGRVECAARPRGNRVADPEHPLDGVWVIDITPAGGLANVAAIRRDRT